MKTLLKRLQSAVKEVFSRRQVIDPVMSVLHGLELRAGEKDTWIVNAYLGRAMKEHPDYPNPSRW
jgi:hypothetical protein